MIKTLKQLEKLQQFTSFAVEPRIVRLTSGEDGDTMYLTSPKTDLDCRYMGYRVQNTAQDGTHEFAVFSMLDGEEIFGIPYDIKNDLSKLKSWIKSNLENLESKIAKLHKELEQKEKEEKSKKEKEDEKLHLNGYSKTTYYKVRYEVECEDKEVTEMLTLFILHKGGLCGNIIEQAKTIHTLHKCGMLNLKEIKKYLKDKFKKK